MKKYEFDELIEKAFSIGYEMGQREFGAIKRENKKKKREWLAGLGGKYQKGNPLRETIENEKEGIARERQNNIIDKVFDGTFENVPDYDEILNKVSDKDALVSLGRRNGDLYLSSGYDYLAGAKTLNHKINQRGEAEADDYLDIYNQNALENYKKDKFINKIKKDTEKLREKSERITRDMNESIENTKKSLDEAANRKMEAIDRLENIRKIRTLKNLKRAGLALAGIATTAGVAYGAKKLYDKKKKKKEQNKEKEED